MSFNFGQQAAQQAAQQAQQAAQRAAQQAQQASQQAHQQALRHAADAHRSSVHAAQQHRYQSSLRTYPRRGGGPVRRLAKAVFTLAFLGVAAYLGLQIWAAAAPSFG